MIKVDELKTKNNRENIFCGEKDIFLLKTLTASCPNRAREKIMIISVHRVAESFKTEIKAWQQQFKNDYNFYLNLSRNATCIIYGYLAVDIYEYKHNKPSIQCLSTF